MTNATVYSIYLHNQPHTLSLLMQSHCPEVCLTGAIPVLATNECLAFTYLQNLLPSVCSSSILGWQLPRAHFQNLTVFQDPNSFGFHWAVYHKIT